MQNWAKPLHTHTHTHTKPPISETWETTTVRQNGKCLFYKHLLEFRVRTVRGTVLAFLPEKDPGFPTPTQDCLVCKIRVH